MIERRRVYIVAGCVLAAVQSVAPVRADVGKESARSVASAEMRRGEVWATLANWERAAEAFRKALDRDSSYVEARLRLGVALFRSGKPQDGIRETEAAVTLGPGGADGRLQLGDLLKEMKSWEAAGRAYAEALRVVAPRTAGKAHDGAVAAQLARAILGAAEVAHAVASANEGLIATAESRRASELYRRYLALSPRPERAPDAEEALHLLEYGDAGLSFLQGKTELSAGRAAAAVKSFSRALERRGSLDEARYLLGVALHSPSVGRREEARRAWRALAAHAGAQTQLGVSHLEAGELGEAARRLQKAIVLDPRHVLAHYQLAFVYNEVGERPKAEQLMREVMRLEPTGPMAKWASSKLQVWTGRLSVLPEGQVIDVAAEIRVGQLVAERIEARFGVLRQPALEIRLTDILRRLVAVSERRKSLRYAVRIVNAGGLNAVTVHGGRIFLFKGMIDFIERNFGADPRVADDIYAGVLAHEINHAAMRHGIDRLKVAAASLDAIADVDGKTVDKLMRGFGRTQEFESDQYGALYCYRAGFDPSAVVRLFRRAAESGFEVVSGASHPTFAERAARLKEYLLELRAQVKSYDEGLVALSERRFGTAVAAFEVFLGVFPQHSGARNNLAVALMQRAQIGSGSITALGAVFRTMNAIAPVPGTRPTALRGGPDADANARIGLREAQSEFEAVLAADPEFIDAHVNLGAVLMELGELDGAQRSLETALHLDPKGVPARVNIGVLWIHNGMLGRAYEHFAQVVNENPGTLEPLFNLARLEEARGRIAAARRRWTTYLSVDKTGGWADIARKRLAKIK